MSEGNDKDKIVPSTKNSLSTRSSGLVRRGLQDLIVSAPKIGKRILVADDEEAINEVVEQILSSAGYEVKTTTHPSEVVALVADFQPQVALIGLIAPEIDGVKLSEKLSARFPKVKIVLTDYCIEEEILQAVLEKGIPCDTLDTPFTKEDLLGLMHSWAAGSDHIDGPTRLRDARHFEAAFNSLDCHNLDYFRPSFIFIELFQSDSPPQGLDKEMDFLHDFGATLARFARGGFAYRHGGNQFAMLLPRVAREEAREKSRQFAIEANSLLQKYQLIDRVSVAIGVVSVQDDAHLLKQVKDAGKQLIAMVKETAKGGIAAWGLGLIETDINGEWTRD